MSLQVTNVKIIPSRKEGKLKAFVDITLNNLITLRGWKVINGSKGLFLAPPSQKSGDQYYDNILFVDGGKRGSEGDKLRQYLQVEALKSFSSAQIETTSIDQTNSAPDSYIDEVPF